MCEHDSDIIPFGLSYVNKDEDQIERIKQIFQEFIEPHSVAADVIFNNVGAKGDLYTDDCLDIPIFKRALSQWITRHSK